MALGCLLLSLADGSRADQPPRPEAAGIGAAGRIQLASPLPLGDGLHGITIPDAAGRPSVQVAPPIDPHTGEIAPLEWQRVGGAFELVGRGGLRPHVVALDEILLELRTLPRPSSLLDQAGIAFGDLNDDGYADLVGCQKLFELGHPSRTQYRISIYFGGPDSRGFVDAEVEGPDAAILSLESPGSGVLQSLLVAEPGDFDADGTIDLLVLAQESDADGREDFVYLIRGPFEPGMERSLALDPPEVTYAGFAEPSRIVSDLAVAEIDGLSGDDFLLVAGHDPAVIDWVGLVFGLPDPDAHIDLQTDTSRTHRIRNEGSDVQIQRAPMLLDFSADGLAEAMLTWRRGSLEGGSVFMPETARVPGESSAQGLVEEPDVSRLLEPLLPAGGYWGGQFDAHPGRAAVRVCPGGQAILASVVGAWSGSELLQGSFVMTLPRPRDFWRGPTFQPDHQFFCPPVPTPMPGLPPPFLSESGHALAADMDGDGALEVVQVHPLAGDPELSTPGHGFIYLTRLSPASPSLVQVTSANSLVIDPGPDIWLSGSAQAVAFQSQHNFADFNGDGVLDLLVTGQVPLTGGPSRLILRIYDGAKLLDRAPLLSCGEQHELVPGDALLTDRPLVASQPVAAWGRVEVGGVVSSAVERLQPPGPILPGDPVLEVSGEALGAILSPAAPQPTRPHVYKGHLALGVPGVVTVESPPVALDAAGSFSICFEPGNLAPLVEAGPDHVIHTAADDEDCQATVHLTGLAHDLDCDALRVRWELGTAVLAESPELELALPVGLHELRFVAADGLSESEDVVSVEVIDATPPQLTVPEVAGCIWPPNHRWTLWRLGEEVPVALSDNCTAEPELRLVEVRSSEPADALGDGSTGPDWELLDDTSVLLRAERDGRGLGRRYVLVLEARDAADNVAQVETQVLVPHDRRSSECEKRPPRSPMRGRRGPRGLLLLPRVSTPLGLGSLFVPRDR